MHLFVAFWSLAPFDVITPVEKYEEEMSRIKNVNTPYTQDLMCYIDCAISSAKTRGGQQPRTEQQQEEEGAGKVPDNDRQAARGTAAAD